MVAVDLPLRSDHVEPMLFVIFKRLILKNFILVDFKLFPIESRIIDRGIIMLHKKSILFTKLIRKMSQKKYSTQTNVQMFCLPN